MPQAHRHTDERFCGGKTIVLNQSTVFVNNLLWAVQNDPNDHCGGNLIPVVGKTIYIENKLIICAVGDTATPDNGDACLGFHPSGATDPKDHSPNVYVYSS